MSVNDENPSSYFGDISQLTNWILDSGATSHMTPQISDFIPALLEDTDQYIQGADEHPVTAKQGGKFQIKTCNDNMDISSRNCTTYFWY